MDFEELKDDKKMQEMLSNFHCSIDKIESTLETVLNGVDYTSLDVKDKISYDLFLTYALNTLYWMYLRSKGVDPNNNDVKNELGRIKEHMVKAKQAHERNTIRPRIQLDVAKRFIKHGTNPNTNCDNIGEPPAKKKHLSKD